MSGAWVLELGMQRSVAVGVREQLQLLSASAAQELADAPACCAHRLVWNERVVPVVDLGVALDGNACEAPQRLIGVYAYEADATKLGVGALWLAQPPRLLQVDDSAACALPEQWKHLADLALSCFALDGRAVPIIDLAALFTGRLVAGARGARVESTIALTGRRTDVRAVAADRRNDGCELSLREERR